MNTAQDLLPLSHTARRLRVPVNWLRLEAEAGRLPCLRAGRVLLFVPEVIARILAERALQLPQPETEVPHA